MMSWLKEEQVDKLSNVELISRYKYSHDEIYVGILFKKYTHLVIANCLKQGMSIQESQQVAFNLFEKLKVILKKQNIGNISTWLHQKIPEEVNNIREINALNKAGSMIPDINDLRNHQLYKEINVNKEDLIAVQNLQEALSQIDENQKKCVELFYIEGKNFTQIAEETGLEQEKINKLIQLGKQSLKRIIEDFDSKLD